MEPSTSKRTAGAGAGAGAASGPRPGADAGSAVDDDVAGSRGGPGHGAPQPGKADGRLDVR